MTFRKSQGVRYFHITLKNSQAYYYRIKALMLLKIFENCFLGWSGEWFSKNTISSRNVLLENLKLRITPDGKGDVIFRKSLEL